MKHRNKLPLVFIFIFIFVLIKSPQPETKEVEIYAVNMMYACGECVTYKIFELKKNPPSYKNDNNLIYENDSQFIQKANRARGDISKKVSGLVGSEFHIIFSNNEERSRFETIEDKIKYPACYIYYFKGILTNKRRWLFENYNLLTISKYRVIQDENCIHENDNY